MAAATLQARKQTVCLFKADGDADTGAFETVLKVSIMGCDLHALPWQVLPTRRCRQRRRHTVIDGRSRT